MTEDTPIGFIKPEDEIHELEQEVEELRVKEKEEEDITITSIPTREDILKKEGHFYAPFGLSAVPPPEWTKNIDEQIKNRMKIGSAMKIEYDEKKLLVQLWEPFESSLFYSEGELKKIVAEANKNYKQIRFTQPISQKEHKISKLKKEWSDKCPK